MYSRLIGAQTGGAGQNQDLTRYSAFGGSVNVATLALEPTVQMRLRDSYTASALFIRVLTNTVSANSTFSFRINAANSSNLTLTVSSDATGAFEDTSGTDSLVTGDLVDAEMVTGVDAGGVLTRVSIAITLLHAGSVSPQSAYNNGAGPAATAYSLLGSGCILNNNTTASNRQVPWRFPTTLRNLLVYFSANTRDGDSTYNTYINDATGNLAVTITASTTGEFEDTSNVDTVPRNATVAAKLTFGGAAGTYTHQWLVCESSNGHVYSSLINSAISAANYAPLGCATTTNSISTTEATAQVTARMGITRLHNLFVNISANSRDAASTHGLRQNGVTVISVSVPSSTTGNFEENGTRIVLADADNVNFITDPSAGSSGTVTPLIMAIQQSYSNMPLAGSWMNRQRWTGGMN